jgi:hypothetical protein
MLIGISIISCKSKNEEQKKVEKEKTSSSEAKIWEVDFLDEFDTFNPDNWQDQRIWV